MKPRVGTELFIYRLKLSIPSSSNGCSTFTRPQSSWHSLAFLPNHDKFSDQNRDGSNGGIDQREKEGMCL